MDPQQIIEKYQPREILQALQLEAYRREFPKFAEELLKISPKYVSAETGGLVPFVLNSTQRRVYETAMAQKERDGWIRLRVLKARQQGVSTLVSGMAYQMVSLTPHTNAIIFAHDDTTSEHVMKMVHKFYDNMPPQYKPELFSRTDGLTFVDPASPPGYKNRRIGSSITYQTARTTLSGTGKTYQFVQLSEAAKYSAPRELWESLNAAIPDLPGTAVIEESTGYPTGTWFRERCESAKNDPSDPYQYIFTAWFMIDEYALPLSRGETLTYTLEEKQRVKEFGLTPEQIKWYRYKLRSYGNDDLAAEEMKQEYPETDEQAWTSREVTAFDRRKLYTVIRDMLRPPVRVCDIMPDGKLLDNGEGLLEIWEEPHKGELYDIGADVASGEDSDTHDWSVACVMRRSSRTQVAQWRGKLDPIDYASVLYHLGLYYNQATIAVETTGGLGYGTNEQLHKLFYPRLYQWRRRGGPVPEITEATGWQTSNTSKNYLVSTVRHYVINDRLQIRSSTLWEEMKTFRPTTAASGQRTYGALPGKFDDCVMAMMIAVIVGDDERGDPGFEAEEEREPRRVQVVDPALVDEFNIHRPRFGDTLRDIAAMLKGED